MRLRPIVFRQIVNWRKESRRIAWLPIQQIQMSSVFYFALSSKITTSSMVLQTTKFPCMYLHQHHAEYSKKDRLTPSRIGRLLSNFNTIFWLIDCCANFYWIFLAQFQFVTILIPGRSALRNFGSNGRFNSDCNSLLLLCASSLDCSWY